MSIIDNKKKHPEFALFIVLTALFIIRTNLYAQQKAMVSGMVKDKLTGEPLLGANISSTKGDKGVSTDVYGFYTIQLQKGEAILIASFVGYKSETLVLVIEKDFRADVFLEPGIEMDEVKVTAQKPIEERMDLGAIGITPKQIKNMPMLGEPDVLKTLQLMPGVQGGAEGRSGLYVRGGSPDQNLFLLDGTPLYYVNHLGGFVSVFHPDILKNITLYKGGYPARFGGRLSSVVDLRMKEGNKKEIHGTAGLGLISGDLSIEGPLFNEKTSFIVSGRRIWTDLITRPVSRVAFDGASLGYNFYDFFGKITHEANLTNRIFLTIYGGDDNFAMNFRNKNEKVKSNTRNTWGNFLSTIRWNHTFNTKHASDITLFYTRYRFNNKMAFESDTIEGKNAYFTGVHDSGIKADFNFHFSNRTTIRYGGGISSNWFIPGQIMYFNLGNGSKIDTVFGKQNRSEAIQYYTYLENEISPLPFLSLNFGARITGYSIKNTNYISLEPRIMANLSLKDAGALKIGYTKMMQPVHMLTYSGSTFPTDFWLPSTDKISPSKSSQFSSGYFKTFQKGMYEISLEGYIKSLTKLIEIRGGVPLVNNNDWEYNVEKNGIGISKGIELMLRKNIGKNNGWISYSLSKATRQFENINSGNPYAFKYDRRNDLSIVYIRQFSEKIDFSAVWVYGTGYPVTLNYGKYDAVQPFTNIIRDPNNNSFVMGSENAYVYPGKNWLQMRDYHRLDLGINFRKDKQSKKGEIRQRTWTIGLYNAYNRQNSVFYYYERQNQKPSSKLVLKQQSGFPILPSFKYSISF